MVESEIWFEKHNFKKNPFDIRPAMQGYDLIGYGNLLKEIIYRIESGNIVFIEGEPGSGKTTILKFVINKFKGQKRLIYFNCNQASKRLDIKQLLMGRYGFWGRKLKIVPRNMILLLDDVNELSKENAERIKFYFDENVFKSVLFTGMGYDRIDFTEGLKHRIGSRIIKLPKLTEEDAILLVRNRIGENQILTNTIIKDLFNISKQNPRSLLENCEDICKYVIRQGREKVKETDLKEVFG